MADFYRVEQDGEPCSACGHGAFWSVVWEDEDGEPVQHHTGYQEKHEAEDMADALNSARVLALAGNGDRLDQATEALRAYEALDEQRNKCEDCAECLERSAEACGECFPFADAARLKMRAFFGREADRG